MISYDTFQPGNHLEIYLCVIHLINRLPNAGRYHRSDNE